MSIRNRVPYFNKYFLNRVLRVLGYASRGPFAMIRHVGRKSGKAYETPIIVQPIEGGFVIALTYGSEVDWYRNIVAAGHCQILWHRREYTISKIEPMTAEAALPNFSRPEKAILRRVGIQHFIHMEGGKGE